MLTQEKLNEKYKKKIQATKKQRKTYNFNSISVERKIPKDLADYSEVKKLKRKRSTIYCNSNR